MSSPQHHDSGQHYRNGHHYGLTFLAGVLGLVLTVVAIVGAISGAAYWCGVVGNRVEQMEKDARTERQDRLEAQKALEFRINILERKTGQKQ